MKLIVIAAAALLASAAAGQSAQWPVEPLCEGGKLVGLRVPVPSGAPPGLFITVRLTDPTQASAVGQLHLDLRLAHKQLHPPLGGEVVPEPVEFIELTTGCPHGGLAKRLLDDGVVAGRVAHGCNGVRSSHGQFLFGSRTFRVTWATQCRTSSELPDFTPQMRQGPD